MRGIIRGALVPLALAAAVPMGAAFAQTPAAQSSATEASRPSFRDTRRLDPSNVAPSPAPPPAGTVTTSPASVPEPAAAKPAPAKAAGPHPAAPAWLKHLAAGACGSPTLATKALAAGRMQVDLNSACRAGETVTWRYGGAERQATLDKDGRSTLTVDCFAGATTPVEIVLADKTRAELPVETLDLSGITKVALVWRGSESLGLHAFEHAASPGRPGHVWAGAAASAPEAMARAAAGPRGTGFLEPSEVGGGSDHVEVYTFVHARSEQPSHIAFGVERKASAPKATGTKPAEGITDEAKDRSDSPAPTTAATEACTEGGVLEIPFRMIVLVAGGTPTTSNAIIAGPACQPTASTTVRLDSRLLPALRLGSR